MERCVQLCAVCVHACVLCVFLSTCLYVLCVHLSTSVLFYWFSISQFSTTMLGTAAGHLFEHTEHLLCLHVCLMFWWCFLHKRGLPPGHSGSVSLCLLHYVVVDCGNRRIQQSSGTFCSLSSTVPSPTL